MRNSRSGCSGRAASKQGPSHSSPCSMSLLVTNGSVGASDRTRPSLRTRIPAASQPSTSSTAEREICSSVASSVCSASRSRAIDAMRWAKRRQSMSVSLSVRPYS
ncbi:hypothetical protein GA0115245_11612 [Streptomyces sp. di188]|nr:hypothetical protein GA0115245_11612 [Streptomyces sp. di188]